MGRETVAVCHWKGDTAEVKLHLDSAMLSLRGGIRADIPRADFADVLLISEGVQVLTEGPALVIEFGRTEATRWQKALLKTPPTLAQKLGVSAETPVFILGSFEDQTLSDALGGATSPLHQAALLLAVIDDEADLLAASDRGLVHPDKHIWMVYRKGKDASIGGTTVRSHMRDLGFIDSKSCAVSDQLTATRYRVRG